MGANTAQKARLLDLTTGMLELTRDEKRDIEQVCSMLQIIKDDPDFAKRLLAKNGEPVTELLLEPVGTIAVSATAERFVAKDKFMIDTGRKALVKISYLGDNFTEWFLGKTEGPFAGSTLRYSNLRKDSLDVPIVSELGGEEKAETTLAEIYTLMELQRDGRVGVLLNNGYANIFYVRGGVLVLRAVSVLWGGDGWNLIAYPLGNPRGWDAGRQVFSRNS
ncbi:hypothetical protein A3B18_01370 [Candidatus Giovannonibacteria bacterium RIFCSPLOWO2_01_FULL_46_13]|uniref:Uncharacterized protein n=1 Tax=Candidatus Giovannonibacteria bacterium RIFCSPLOWO2_01_FULL_46_13 TaxID=1798352 RepID=A0A1F5X3Y5_9BACT|nr:MAG: hypothetical protein A3B18_01370 [Candidatus Giovannonibacteria bacterium RIFCSPLOWO2_01_FULL_46_13]